jgi:hypothetical protein
MSVNAVCAFHCWEGQVPKLLLLFCSALQASECHAAQATAEAAKEEQQMLRAALTASQQLQVKAEGVPSCFECAEVEEGS